MAALAADLGVRRFKVGRMSMTPVLAFLAWFWGVTEWLLIQTMSPVSRRLGFAFFVIKGQIANDSLINIEARVWGVRVRDVMPGLTLVRPRLWWEPGPSADPLLPLFIGVIRSDRDHFLMEVRGALGFYFFVALAGAIAWRETGLWSLVWVFAVCAGFILSLSRARRVFQRIGREIGMARAEQAVAADEARLSPRSVVEPRR